MANSPFSSLVGQRRAQALLSRSGKQKISLGPWPRGMYTNVGTIDEIPEGSAQTISNLNPTPHGTYKGRGRFAELRPVGSSTAWTTYIIGSSGSFVFFQQMDGTTNTKVHVLDNVNWSSPNPYTNASFTDSRSFCAGIVYNNNLWLVPSLAGTSTGKGGFLNPYTSLTGAFTAAANMPSGSYALVHRDRLFIVNATTSRVYYSKATDFTVWAAPDGGFFDVSPGDGESVTGFALIGDVIYIFKQNSIWMFSFVTDPATDGYLRRLTNAIGSHSNVVTLDNVIYFGYNYKVYALQGTKYQSISENVFVASPITLLIVHKKLMVIVGTGSVSTALIYHTLKGVWTQWVQNLIISNTNKVANNSSFVFGPGYGLSVSSSSSNITAYIPGPNSDTILNYLSDESEGPLSTPAISPYDIYLAGNQAINYTIVTHTIRMGNAYYKVYGFEIDFAASQSFSVSATLIMSNPTNISYSLTIPAPVNNTYWEGIARLIPTSLANQRIERSISSKLAVTFTTTSSPGFSWLVIKNLIMVCSAPKADINTIQRTLTS